MVESVPAPPQVTSAPALVLSSSSSPSSSPKVTGEGAFSTAAPAAGMPADAATPLLASTSWSVAACSAEASPAPHATWEAVLRVVVIFFLNEERGGSEIAGTGKLGVLRTQEMKSQKDGKLALKGRYFSS